MTDDLEKRLAITVARLTMGVAACFQGLDILPPEERSSTAALSLLNHALEEMAFQPTPEPLGREFERRLLASLQVAAEGPSMWVEGATPGQVIH